MLHLKDKAWGKKWFTIGEKQSIIRIVAPFAWNSALISEVPLNWKRGEINMTLYPLQPMLALIAGILILVRPALLNYIVAIYLILIGVIGLAHF